MAQQAKPDFRVFKRLLTYTKPYRGKLVFAFTCALTLAILSPTRPLLIVWIVRKYVLESQNPALFSTWLLAVLGMLLVEAILQFSATYFSNLLAQSVIRDLRVKVFEHITTFRMRYFDKTPVGNLVTRVVSDIEAIADVFSSGLIDIISDMLMLIFIIGIMLWINWQLTLLALIPVGLLIYATRIFARAIRKSYQQESVQVNRLNTFVQERITGMNIVQLHGREDIEYDNFVSINKDHRKAHIDAVWAYSIFFPVVEFLSSFSMAFLILWGAFVYTGVLENDQRIFTDIFAFSMWIGMLYRPIRQMADKFNVLQRGMVRAERVFQIIDTEEHVQESGTVENCDFQQPLRFTNVSFAYTEDHPVLKNINLTIEPGKTVAFVGATGAGKTSIVNLLGRFYEYQEGTIHIGAHELREIKMDVLRRNIAVVLQDIFLFSDSVHNNITLGNPAITREEVVAAAKAVGADTFIQKLPGGYNYNVGERGGVLSVGQRQLLAFIRAYVYNPHILILDEATSSVDNESEEMIQEATTKLTKGRTSIVIAHRLSTIQQADTIVVLDKGEIKETGTHEELLRLDGYYKRLFNMQFARS